MKSNNTNSRASAPTIIKHLFPWTEIPRAWRFYVLADLGAQCHQAKGGHDLAGPQATILSGRKTQDTGRTTPQNHIPHTHILCNSGSSIIQCQCRCRQRHYH